MKKILCEKSAKAENRTRIARITALNTNHCTTLAYCNDINLVLFNDLKSFLTMRLLKWEYSWEVVEREVLSLVLRVEKKNKARIEIWTPVQTQQKKKREYASDATRTRALLSSGVWIHLHNH